MPYTKTKYYIFVFEIDTLQMEFIKKKINNVACKKKRNGRILSCKVGNSQKQPERFSDKKEVAILNEKDFLRKGKLPRKVM